VLKTCSLHCTHCQVTFKVLFLLEISLQSQRCLFLLCLQSDRLFCKWLCKCICCA
jgi:hypothetical protein